ncbi:hypothetical protein [Sphingomonas sp. Leaf62]|uniref:hypothetical protein n=1 Tax=Sphingomonas sp. Leaf62 TaxID=1736228 RepID=UPI0006F29BA2|nr:hypothetical protein [Sphingomonas sp. Leaf62]KQN71860.1 hypothetical protein ASE91_03920 [Sphingomonas sp. Leaf62]
MRSAFLILTLIATTGPAIAATRPPTTTWGKPGVSFDAYRRDARECAVQGAKADIGGWKSTKEVVAATRDQDRILENQTLSPNNPMIDYAMVYHRRIRGNVEEVQQTMVGAVEECLIGRGYREVVLDKAQERQLRKLKWGTEARARYLHALATREPGVGNSAPV